VGVIECVQESTATSTSTSIETDSPEKPTAADFECWPPEIGSFVAVTDAEGTKEQVAAYLKKTPRAWSLGKIEKIFLDGEFPMVTLILYGTADANTLKGTYGPARRLGKEGTRTERWKFDRGEEYESKAARNIYMWSECKTFDFKLTSRGKIPVAAQNNISLVLEEYEIPFMQKVVVA